MKIYYTLAYEKQYQTLPHRIKRKAEDREKLFRQNPFTPTLRTHKLKGRLDGYWAYSITYKYRVIFRFADDDIVYFVDTGTHDIYF